MPVRNPPILQCALTIAVALAASCQPNKDCPESSPPPRANASAAASMPAKSIQPAKPSSSSAAGNLTPQELRHKLAEVMLTRAAHQQVVHQASSVIGQALKSSGQPQPAGLSEQLDAIVGEALPYEDVLAISAKVYGERFSPKELRELMAFYQTDTGAKLLKQQTAITQEVASRVSQLVSQRWPGLMKKHGLTQ